MTDSAPVPADGYEHRLPWTNMSVGDGPRVYRPACPADERGRGVVVRLRD